MSKNTKIGVRPIGDRAIVTTADAIDELTSGGIILPDSARQQPDRATVVALGNMVSELDIALGSIVILPPFSGTPIEVNGENYRVINCEDIIAILD
jgi:chaperonin GroES